MYDIFLTTFVDDCEGLTGVSFSDTIPIPGWQSLCLFTEKCVGGRSVFIVLLLQELGVGECDVEFLTFDHGILTTTLGSTIPTVLVFFIHSLSNFLGDTT